MSRESWSRAPSLLDQRISELLQQQQQQQEKPDESADPSSHPLEFFRFSPYSSTSSIVRVGPTENLFRTIAVSFFAACSNSLVKCLSAPQQERCFISISTVRIQQALRGQFPAAYDKLIVQKYDCQFHEFLRKIPGLVLFQYTPAIMREHPVLSWICSSDELRCSLHSPNSATTIHGDLLLAMHTRQAVEHDLVGFCEYVFDSVLRNTCWMSYAVIRRLLWIHSYEMDSHELPAHETTSGSGTSLRTEDSASLQSFVSQDPNKGGWSRRNTAVTEMVWLLYKSPKKQRRISPAMLRYAVSLLLECLRLDPQYVLGWCLPPPASADELKNQRLLLRQRTPSVPVMATLSHVHQRRYMMHAVICFVMGPTYTTDSPRFCEKLSLGFLITDTNRSLMTMVDPKRSSQEPPPTAADSHGGSSFAPMSSSAQVVSNSDAAFSVPQEHPAATFSGLPDRVPRQQDASGTTLRVARPFYPAGAKQGGKAGNASWSAFTSSQAGLSTVSSVSQATAPALG